MTIAVDAQTGQPLGATTEHIPQWICKGGATTRMAGLCVNPYGRSVFGSRPSSRLGLEPNPSPRRCSEFFNGLLTLPVFPTGFDRGRESGVTAPPPSKPDR